ncbi:hypothetical protein GUITHDRAFT_59438, partial [Guillardia theta CCMP2712]
WVDLQRRMKRSDRLEAEREKILNDIGFVWNALEKGWYSSFNDLVLFAQNFGHSHVPSDFCQNNASLGRWVREQRRRMKKQRISESKSKWLRSIGFVSDRLLHRW